MTEPAPLPRGTYTFLFTDIEGSTDLEARIGRDATRRSASAIETLLREAWAANGGIEQGTEGDSFFVVFPEAPAAVAAAVAAQRALAAEPWPDDAPIRVRMGLNTGGADVSGDSLVGLEHQPGRPDRGGRPRRPDPRVRADPRPARRRPARRASGCATSASTGSRT